MTDPIDTGRSKIAGWDSHPQENAALARRTPEADIQIRWFGNDVTVVNAESRYLSTSNG